MKKYEVDFWGYLTSCTPGKSPIFFKKIFRLFCRKYRFKIWFLRQMFEILETPFSYTIAKIQQKKKNINYNKTYIKHLHILLKFRIYYGDMTIKKFKRYLQKVNQRRADFISKICFLLESRLDILLCRLNFFNSPGEARKFIKKGWFKVNTKIVQSLNYTLYINDIIEPANEDIWIFLNAFLYKKIDNFLFNYPRYVEMNYKILKCIFIMYPRREDIPSTWKLDFAFLRNLIA